MTEADRAFWFRLDRHLPEAEFARKVRDRRGYVILAEGTPVGLLRYNLFWDSTPFCTLLYIDAPYRGQGCGRMLMERWEADMCGAGFGLVMVSTQADETAQHFYRKLGHRDCGGFTMDVPGDEQPLELMMLKTLPRGSEEGPAKGFGQV